MRNHHQPAGRLPPDCAAIAALLPLLSDETLDPRDAGRIHGHLSGCASCQAQQRAYARLDAALRQHFGPTAFTSLRTEEIMEKLPDTDSAFEPPEAAPPPSASALANQRRPRRLLSGVASVAAVLVLALLAALIFAGHSRPDTGATNSAGQTYTSSALLGISMVSPEEGWAVGDTSTYRIVSEASSSSSSTLPFSSSYTVLSGNGPESGDVLLYHYQHGAWTQVHIALHVVGIPRLTAISMDSPTDGWAVGGATSPSASGDTPTTQPAATQGILVHYDGTTWKQVPSPVQAMLGRIYIVSATNGWALTESTVGTPPAILHYDGSAWTVQALPASLTADASQGFLSLTNLTALTGGEAWISGLISPGNGSSGTTGFILHYTAGAWTVQATFANVIVSDIAMAAPNDGWATGQDVPVTSSSTGNSPQQASASPSSFLLRYSTGHWKRVAAALPGENSTTQIVLFSISLVSPTSGWLIGIAQNNATGMVIQGSPASSSADGSASQLSLVLLRYDGSRWSAVAGPSLPARATPEIRAADFVSPSEGWVVGSLVTVPARPGGLPSNTSLALHYSNGVWSMAHL